MGKGCQSVWPLKLNWFLIFSLFFLVIGSSAWAAGQTPQKELSDTVEVLCPILAGQRTALNPAELDVLKRCGEVKRRGGQSFESLNTQQQTALTNMTSEETDTMGTVTVEMAGGQQAIITQRLAGLRPAISSGVAALNPRHKPYRYLLASTNPSLPEASEASASALGGRLGFFVNGNYTTGDKDTTAREPGFDFDGLGFTVGADYQVTDSFIVGAAAGYSRAEADIVNNTGNLDADGFGVSLYSSVHFGRFYLDGIGSLGWKDYQTQRNINYTIGSTVVNEAFLGDTDATEYGLSIGGGYDLPMGAFSLSPFARFNYLKSEIDGFSERSANPNNATPGFGLALQLADQEITSLNTEIGATVSYALSTSWGVVSPHLRANWTHEFDNDAQTIQARFVNGGTTPNAVAANRILIPTDDPDRDYVNFGVGVNMVLPRGWMFFVEYATVLFLDDVSLHQATGGIRIAF